METTMRRRAIGTPAIIGAVIVTLVAGACGSNGKKATTATTSPAAGAGSTAAPGPLKTVKLQLQWFTQAQFAGYFAAADQGFFKKLGLDVQIIEGGTDIVPQTVLAQGGADFAIAWVPKALASREQGANITDIAQIFQRSGTLQVSFKDKAITSPSDLKGKKVGNWGFGNEFELFAGMTKSGLNPAKDVQLVQQQFDMKALLNRDIDAAQAMVYNEYAQVLEATDPKTGKLYQPSDFNAINWNDVGTSMLQDAIWAQTDKLKDPTFQDTAVKFIEGSIEGWVFCRDNPQKCRDIVVARGSKLGNSHQLWQMNEINKLIWPSPKGAGYINPSDWDRTVQIALNTKNADGKTVLIKAPDAAAYTDDYVTKALDALKQQGVDVDGSGFAPMTVTLQPGGN
jgi:NitT/TauT family transport system substrate-binding protein